MDERSFDDLMKQKIGNYEDPIFDEQAFANFRDSYKGIQHGARYQRYKTETIVVSALIVFTLFNYFVTRNLVDRKEHANPMASVPALPKETAISDSVFTLISELKMQNNNLTQQIHELHLRVVRQHKEQLAMQQAINHEDDQQQNTALVASNEERMYQDSVLINKRDQFQYVLVRPVETKLTTPKPIIVVLRSQHDTGTSATESIHDRTISAKTKSELEQHYFNGLGINIAPHVDGLVNNFSGSRPQMATRFGVLADLVLSPRVSIVTGVDYSTTRLLVHSDFEKWPLPVTPDSNFCELRRASIDTRTFSLPVGVRFKRWISSRNQLISQVGYTPYLAFRKRTTLSYALAGGGYDHDDDTLDRKYEENINQFFGSTAKVSLGISHELKKKQKFEASIAYERSFGSIKGIGHRLQIFGLNLAYWYHVR